MQGLKPPTPFTPEGQGEVQEASQAQSGRGIPVAQMGLAEQRRGMLAGLLGVGLPTHDLAAEHVLRSGRGRKTARPPCWPSR